MVNVATLEIKKLGLRRANQARRTRTRSVSAFSFRINSLGHFSLLFWVYLCNYFSSTASLVHSLFHYLNISFYIGMHLSLQKPLIS